MQAGKLRTTITIEKVGTAVDANGDVAPTYTYIDKRKAWVRGLTGREFMAAQQTGSDVTNKVTMRYYEGLTPEHRFLVDGRTLEILSVLNVDERNKTMDVMCKENVGVLTSGTS